MMITMKEAIVMEKLEFKMLTKMFSILIMDIITMLITKNTKQIRLNNQKNITQSRNTVNISLSLI